MTLPADPAERHRAVTAGFTARVQGASDWDAPAPVPGWRARDGMEFGFHGCFHEVRPDRIVQTFTWEGDPDDVALQTLVFEDLGHGRTRLRTQSLCDSFEGRDAWLRSGMEVGVDQGYAKLDALLAAGEIAGTAEGVEA